MTATSHHALQLAHAAGMLSALVHTERAAIDSRTWGKGEELFGDCLLYTSPSPRDRQKSRMPSSA